jgi:hypothetical protein
VSVTSAQRKSELYREQNQAAARIITADPERYAGIMLEWARLTLERNTPAPAANLFESEAA